jgi:type IV pilus assembly protein PilA
MRICGLCGATSPADATFCVQCGKALTVATPPPKTSPLAIVAIVCACVPCVSLLGLILGIVALTQIGSRPKEKGGRGIALAAVVVGSIMTVLIGPAGIMAAIAIPNFIRFQARAKQSECKSNLRAFFTAEKSYFAEHDEYSKSIQALGFEPERGNRYAYFVDRSGTLEDRSSTAARLEPDDVGVQVDLLKFTTARAVKVEDIPAKLAGGVRLGISGKCPECEVTMACAGNIRDDAKLDVWSVSTADRKDDSGEVIPAGQPFNDVNDLNR